MVHDIIGNNIIDITIRNNKNYASSDNSKPQEQRKIVDIDKKPANQHRVDAHTVAHMRRPHE